MSDKTAYNTLLIVSIFCILFFIFLIPFRFSGSLIRSDGVGYYSYLRSLVFDRDVNHYNEFIHFNYLPKITSTGFTHNQWTIGPALLWMPFYLLAHLMIIIINKLGFFIQMDGYGFLYQFSVCLGTIIYVSAGFFLIYRISRRYFSEFSSILAVLGIWLGANPIYYTIIEPSMSQGVQLFTVALFMYIWLPLRPRAYKDWVFLELSIGLMALVHWQNLIFVSIIIVEIYYSLIENKMNNKWIVARRYIKRVLITGCAAFLVYTPQMLAWNAMFGFPIVNPRGPGQIDLLHPKLFQYLFSPGCSLFTWTPVIFLAILGFIPLYKKDKKVSLCLLVTLIIQWYFYSCIGYKQGSYGARHFVSSSPIFVLAIAALIEARIKKHPKEYLGILIILFILLIWNFLFIVQYTLKFIPHDGSISWNELVWGKFQMIKHLMGHIKVHF